MESDVTEKIGRGKDTMNRLARWVRTLGGIFLLMHLVCFFLPFLIVKQENYPTRTYSAYSEVKRLFAHGITQFGSGVDNNEIALLIGSVILPLLLAVIFGVWAIFGNKTQRVTSAGSILIALADGVFLWRQSMFAPKHVYEAQQFCAGIGRNTLLGICIACAIFGVAVLICIPQRKKLEHREEIPNVQSMKEEQLKPRYEFVDEAEEKRKLKMEKENEVIQETPNIPAGSLVGIAGMYAGAVITLQPGEILKLGRDNSNDLIFDQADRISRNHCQIRYIAETGCFQILDYSSNGCFVDGREECIPQNIVFELPTGTILDIGDNTNRFRLV